MDNVAIKIYIYTITPKGLLYTTLITITLRAKKNAGRVQHLYLIILVFSELLCFNCMSEQLIILILIANVDYTS